MSVRSSKITISCFKIVDQVQDQGGTDCSTAGIYVIFRGLNDFSQHRDRALDAILKQLLNQNERRVVCRSRNWKEG